MAIVAAQLAHMRAFSHRLFQNFWHLSEKSPKRLPGGWMGKAQLLQSALLVCLVLACSTQVSAETLFSYVDENGVRILTNIPPKSPAKGLQTSGQPTPKPEETPSGKDRSGGDSYESIIGK